jgi:hypothetical protein
VPSENPHSLRAAGRAARRVRKPRQHAAFYAAASGNRTELLYQIWRLPGVLPEVLHKVCTFVDKRLKTIVGTLRLLTNPDFPENNAIGVSMGIVTIV